MQLIEVWNDIQKVDLPDMGKVEFKQVSKKFTFDRSDFFLAVSNTTIYKTQKKHIEFSIVNSYENIEDLFEGLQNKDIERLLLNENIDFTPYNFAVFAILHELGHVYSYTYYSVDKVKELERNQEKTIVYLEENGVRQERIQTLYREFILELFADNFALEHIYKIIER